MPIYIHHVFRYSVSWSSKKLHEWTICCMQTSERKTMQTIWVLIPKKKVKELKNMRSYIWYMPIHRHHVSTDNLYSDPAKSFMTEQYIACRHVWCSQERREPWRLDILLTDSIKINVAIYIICMPISGYHIFYAAHSDILCPDPT